MAQKDPLLDGGGGDLIGGGGDGGGGDGGGDGGGGDGGGGDGDGGGGLGGGGLGGGGFGGGCASFDASALDASHWNLHDMHHGANRGGADRADARLGGGPGAAIASGTLRILGAPAWHGAPCTSCRLPIEGCQRFARMGGGACLAPCSGRR